MATKRGRDWVNMAAVTALIVFAVAFTAACRGPRGLACWDLDANGVADLPAEDWNQDGNVDALDCHGPQGPPGSPGGLMCWDVNGSGDGNPAEDVNNDGVFNTLDCRGPQGSQGNQGVQGVKGDKGAQGAQGAQGDPGPPVNTVCLSQLGGSGTAMSFCTTACNGASKVVQAVSNYEKSCSVNSDNGICSPGWGRSETSYCCTCRP